VQVAGGSDEQGVGVPPHAELQLQPSWPAQLVGPLNRLHGHDDPPHDFVVLSQTHPSMLMQEKSLNSLKQS
jgi:hypothetical protein